MEWAWRYAKYYLNKVILSMALPVVARTNYLYLTYSGIANDVHYLGDRKSIVVLGSVKISLSEQNILASLLKFLTLNGIFTVAVM